MNVLEVMSCIKELQTDRMSLENLKDKMKTGEFKNDIYLIESCIQMIDDEINKLYGLKIKEQ